MKRIFAIISVLIVAACAPKNGPLPRGKATEALDKAMTSYFQAVKECGEDLHSIMVIQHGKVLAEKFFVPDTAHVLHSVSKTFTSTAVGFAISEGLLSLDDKIVDLFPESVPEGASDTLKRVTIRNLLTMNSGHGTDPTGSVRNKASWNGLLNMSPAQTIATIASAPMCFQPRSRKSLDRRLSTILTPAFGSLLE